MLAAIDPVLQVIGLAAIAAGVTITTLVINHYAKARIEKQRRIEKAQDRQAAIEKEERDYARQDLVAARVEKATRESMAKLNTMQSAVEGVHKIVNSDKTEMMRDQRNTMKVTLALMHQVMSLKDGEPSKEAMDAVQELSERIGTLSEAIETRVTQQHAEQEIVQAAAHIDAANRQIIAAAAQQAAADSQQAVADQMSVSFPHPPLFGK